MRSTNYAYSVAFEFFYRKGRTPSECHKLAKDTVSKYEKGEVLISVMKSLL